jgi:3-deoxy-D-manno-octulosonic-acid transferase
MSPLYGAYKLFTAGLVMVLFPGFWIYARITGRYRRHLSERLGIVPRETLQKLTGEPRIWIHAVSLGEVHVANPIIQALKRDLPQCSIVVSTTTEHGRNLAAETLSDEIPLIYAPIDFYGWVRKSLSAIRPHTMVFLETEIWPAWVSEAHRMGIKTALINGRISPRSVGRYLRLQRFFREVLRNFDAFSMILEDDAKRIHAMGADPKKIRINGNAKYDLLEKMAEPAVVSHMQHLLNLDASQQVFVAGSTRSGEEELIIHAYQKVLEKFPNTLLILTPRHIERTSAIESVLQKRGLPYCLRSTIGDGKGTRTEPVVVVDTFGELFRIYSVATIVFCGGSLVPLGGQNPLEPAVWGKPVLYGPSMENFLDAKALLEDAGGGIAVSNADMLAEKAIWFLSRPSELKAWGERARHAVLKNRGAAEKHARVIRELFNSG